MLISAIVFVSTTLCRPLETQSLLLPSILCQMNNFEHGRIVEMLEADWINRTVSVLLHQTDTALQMVIIWQTQWLLYVIVGIKVPKARFLGNIEWLSDELKFPQ